MGESTRCSSGVQARSYGEKTTAERYNCCSSINVFIVVLITGSCILDLNEEGYENIVKAIVARLVQDEQIDDSTSGLIAQVLHGRHKHQHPNTFWNNAKSRI